MPGVKTQVQNSKLPPEASTLMAKLAEKSNLVKVKGNDFKLAIRIYSMTLKRIRILKRKKIQIVEWNNKKSINKVQFN